MPTTSEGKTVKRVRPPDGCRGPAALANEAMVTGNGPHPPVALEPSPPGASLVVLAGRATRVP
jgi:hypothetical protein